MTAVDAQPAGDAWERRRVRMSLRIERAGLELLRERGLDHVTVDQIAARAGISTRTFFRYFRNPRDVLTAVPARESRRMCAALLARPASESLLDGFHAWFRTLGTAREPAGPTEQLELETMTLWSAIVRDSPDVVQAESRATSALAAELETVLWHRLRFGSEDAEKVGVLAAAFAAVIWWVYAHDLEQGAGTDLSTRLDSAFDLLGRLQVVTEAAPG
jgi:AcrR family transcriptional regulator